MKRLERVLSVIDQINEWTGRIVAYLALFMMVTIVGEVVARYVFNSPTIWVIEVNQYMLCGYVALGGGFALLYKSHVSVDIIHERLGLRTRAIVDAVTAFFFFIFIFVLIWKSWGMAWEALHYWERAETLLGPPLFPAKVAITLGGILIFLQGLAKFIRDIRTFITGVDQSPVRDTGFFKTGGEEK